MTFLKFVSMSLKGGKVLIIEDDKVTQQQLVLYMQNLMAEVQFTESAEEGLDLINAWKPDVIILDMFLKEKSGIEMLDQLDKKTIIDKVVIIAISSDDSEEMKIITLGKGVDEFLAKPVIRAELVLKIQTHFERKKRIREFQNVSEQLNNEREKLSAYFSEDVIAKIMSDQDQDRFLGENIVGTIMFLDIRNFTGISESIEPQQVAELLNLLFTDIMDLIFSFNGSVGKLIGDAILATFGCPMSFGNDAKNAVDCALSILKSIKGFNRVRPKYLKQDISIGIGITTGVVFAGNIGSYKRMEYTVIGDVVNTASRLENLTKKVDSNLLIDKNTRERIGSDYDAIKINVRSVKGKKQEIEIYKLDVTEDEEETTFF